MADSRGFRDLFAFSTQSFLWLYFVELLTGRSRPFASVEYAGKELRQGEGVARLGLCRCVARRPSSGCNSFAGWTKWFVRKKIATFFRNTEVRSPSEMSGKDERS